MPKKKRYIDMLGIWHCEEYRLERDFTDRMKKVRKIALKVVALDDRAERYIVRYLKKREKIINEMRNVPMGYP